MNPSGARQALAIGVVLVWSAWTASARADVFVLSSGGRVEGQLRNPDQTPRTTYEILTAGGVEITLARTQVQRLTIRAERREYERTWPRFADTVDDQWALADWCRQRHLSDQSQRHMQRVLELDPDHEQARHGLGFYRRQGQWTRRKDERAAMGYVAYKGEWMLPQKVQLIEEKERITDAQNEWTKKLKRWRGWLDDGRAVTAREEILQIDDPLAVGPLARALKDEPVDQIRILYIRALAHVGAPSAIKLLAAWSLEDPIEEVRLTCLDQLTMQRDAVDYYIIALRHSDNYVINRAGFALGRLQEPTAIGPLIDALVTVHKMRIKGRPAGSMSPSFGSDGSIGFGAGGGGDKVVSMPYQNREVLAALITLADGPNYSYNKASWKEWYARTRRSHAIGGRRD